MKKTETVCFTGHRILASKDREAIMHKVEETVEPLIHLGFKSFLCGGAIGFEMLVGFTILKARQKYPNIELVLVLPCRDQDQKWKPAQSTAYAQLLLEANQNHYIADNYTQTCMLERNRYLIEHSVYCIAYLMRPYGGTAYTVGLAKEMGVNVCNLANAKQDFLLGTQPQE